MMSTEIMTRQIFKRGCPTDVQGDAANLFGSHTGVFQAYGCTQQVIV